MANNAITESHYLTSTENVPTRDSARDGGFRVILSTRWQAGRCADCGNVSTDMEFAHFKRAAGIYSAGLGAMTCRECNIIHTLIADADGTLPWAYVAGFAILPPAELPSRAECVRVYRESTASVHAGRVAEAARRATERGL